MAREKKRRVLSLKFTELAIAKTVCRGSGRADVVYGERKHCYKLKA